MEERKEEGEAEIQEHGPEHWFSKWERQCLAEAEQDEQLPPELQEEAAAAAQPEHKQQKLWHLFQNSATAVAQLYKGEGSRRHLATATATSGWTLSAESPGEACWPPAAAPQPPPHKMAAWEAGPRGALGGGPGAARETSPSRASPEEPFRCSGLAAGRPRAGEGRGGSPSHKMAKGGGGRAGPIVPEAGLGAGTERGHLPAPRLGLGLRRRAPRLPLPPRRDPFPAFLRVTEGSRNP